MRSSWMKKMLAMLCLSALLLSAPAAFAEESGEISIIDEAEISGIVDNYIQENGLNPDNISVGYCYTATGDRWMYNGDKWYYSASMYKVPLMMILAQQEYEGELTQDSEINGIKLSYLEDMVLTYSHNDYAHHVMNYLGEVPTRTPEGDAKCRELYKQFSSMPEEDYVPNFLDYSYFNTRFMMDVMEKLYFEQERFPRILDCLKIAQPDSYFNRSLAGEYEVAQKYGAFKEFNSTTGIIYTPNPFILTVMTENMGVSDKIIGDMARLMADYTLSLDEKLSAFREQKTLEEKKAQEEAEQEAQQQAEAQRAAQEEEQERQRAEEQQLKEVQRLLERQEKMEKIKKTALYVISAAVLIGAAAIAAALAVKSKRNKKAVPAEKPQGPEKPQRDRTLKQDEPVRKNDSRHYQPRH